MAVAAQKVARGCRWSPLVSLWWPSSSPNTELEKFREVPPRSEVLNEVAGQCIAMWRLITGLLHLSIINGLSTGEKSRLQRWLVNVGISDIQGSFTTQWCVEGVGCDLACPRQPHLGVLSHPCQECCQPWIKKHAGAGNSCRVALPQNIPLMMHFM